jgi:sugar phosphate isomerase/epimerase
VALTLDHDHLDPFGPDLARRTAEVASILDRLGLAVVIETGARYLLDPWRKHAPTLLDDDPALRVQFLRRAVRVGADLGAEAVSFWSGVPPTGATGAAGVTGVTDGPAGASGGPAGGPDGGTFWDRLVRGCAEIVDVAADLSVMLGFEPEPGMLVADIAGWRRLYADLGSPPGFGITLDIGHCQCLEPLPVPECVRAVADHLVNVQIDDMRRGVHEHLEFGTGEIDFPPVLRALAEVGYSGLVAVELPRHSHAAPSVAAHSIAFLRQASIAAGLTEAGQTTSLGM